MDDILVDLTNKLKGPAKDLDLEVYSVTAVDLSTYTVTIRETPSEGTAHPNIPVLEGYWPNVGDNVLVIINGAAYVVLARARVAAEQGWTNVSGYANGWANYGSPSPTASFRRQNGLIEMRGTIKDGTIGQTAFTLPAGFRPTHQRYFATVSNQAFGGLLVAANGDVVPTTGNNAWVDLSPIRFPLD